MITPEEQIRQRLGLDCAEGTYVYYTKGSTSATLDGAFSAADLRKIADDLDPATPPARELLVELDGEGEK